MNTSIGEIFQFAASSVWCKLERAKHVPGRIILLRISV
jgi:hypothetical protein